VEEEYKKERKSLLTKAKTKETRVKTNIGMLMSPMEKTRIYSGDKKAVDEWLKDRQQWSIEVANSKL